MRLLCSEDADSKEKRKYALHVAKMLGFWRKPAEAKIHAEQILA
jgi:hypothetical protein